MRATLAITSLLWILSGACGRIDYDRVAPSGSGGSGGNTSGSGGVGVGGAAGGAGRGGNGAGGSSGGTAGGGAGAGGSAAAGGGGTGGAAGAGGGGGTGTAGSGGAAGSGSGGAAGSASGGAAGSASGGAAGSASGGAAGSASGGAAGGGGMAAGGAGGSTITDGGVACSTAAFGGHAYAFCGATVPWSDAQSDCAAKGMRLARIDDAAENSWVQTTAFASQPSISSVYWLWIGGTDQSVLGQWRWSDGALFWMGGTNGSAQGGLYTNWVGGAPSANASAGTCAIFQHAGFWQDWDCTKLQAYVCEQY